MLGSGLGLLGMVLLFRAEDVGGRRFALRGWRDRADLYLERHSGLFKKLKRFFGTSSLRLLLHYVLHQILSLVLFIIGFLEDRLHRLRMKNKVVAKVIRAKNQGNGPVQLAKQKGALGPPDTERAYTR